ncbi:redoxin domain-containing protein [Chitinophaga defluvii]|uniref:Redoxin domain-containing protein n=1 Tax=Chitinophaga defluvii TaxID=3163343 RepID=A0ABV2TBE6_9BACT
MKYKIILFFFCLPMLASSQHQKPKKGEKVPDIIFGETFNNPKATTRLSDLQGKLVILDFWGFTCASCLEAFPKLDNLQKEFGEKIKIVAVSRENSESVAKFFKTHVKVHFPNLLFITGDTTLRSMFSGINGGYVWIDSKGTFLFEADPYNLTAENIRAILEDRPSSIQESVRRVSMKTAFDERIRGQIAYSSIITRHNHKTGVRPPGSEPGMQTLADLGSIQYLYQRAFEQTTGNVRDFFEPGRVILEVKDTSHYTPPPGLKGLAHIEWTDQHLYGYQLVLPEGSKHDLHKLMQQDLDRFFGLKGSVEKRYVSSYVLIRKGRKDMLQTRGDTAKDSFIPTYIKSSKIEPLRVLVNQPFSVLADRLKTLVILAAKKPLVNKTGYKGNIDITMTGEEVDSENIQLLKKALNRYGLDLVEKKVKMDVLVIKEKTE